MSSRHATAPFLAPPPPSQFDAAAVSEALHATAARFPGLAPGVAGALGAVAVHSLSDAAHLPTGASLTPGLYANALDQQRHWSSTLPGHGGAAQHRAAVRGPPPAAGEGAPRWDDAPSAVKARPRLGGGAHGGMLPSEAEEQTVAALLALLIALKAAETAPGQPRVAPAHHLGAQAVRAANAVAAASAVAAGTGGNVASLGGVALPHGAGLQASQQGVPLGMMSHHHAAVPALDGPLLPSQQGAGPRPLTWEDIGREASVSSRDPQLVGATVEQLVEAAAVYDHPGAKNELKARLALAVAALRVKQAEGHPIWPLPEQPQI